MTKTKVNKKTGEIQMEFPYIRKPHERHRHYTPVHGKSMTHQSHAETCDINNIIRKFDNTGVLPPARHEAQYADVTGLQKDLTQAHNDALETIDKTEKHFKKKDQEKKQTEKQKQLDLEKQIEELKKEKGESNPVADRATSPSPTTTPKD